MAGIMTVRAPDKLKQELNKIAKSDGYTRNALILQILNDWLKSRKDDETA